MILPRGHSRGRLLGLIRPYLIRWVVKKCIIEVCYCGDGNMGKTRVIWIVVLKYLTRAGVAGLSYSSLHVKTSAVKQDPNMCLNYH